MGRQEVEDDAVALTPSLYLGYVLSMEHFVLATTDDLDKAVEHIRAGGIVRTPVRYLATMLLVRLHVPVNQILKKLHDATHVQPEDADLSI
jgi:hypothetical protein